MLLIIPVIPIALWFAGSAGSDQGSARLASEWRALLSQFNDPDTAVYGEIGEMGFHPLTLGEQHETIGLQEAADGRTPEAP